MENGNSGEIRPASSRSWTEKKTGRKGWLKSAAVTLAAAMLIAGCGQNAKTGGPDPSPTGTASAADPTPVETPAPTPSGPQFPLTGRYGEKAEDKVLRPVMIMVENAPQARPQTGLDEADLVYEILAEGEVTRFAAVYQSRSPEIIGPVRSIRPYYVEIGDGLDALIVHAGWSQDAINLIKGRKLAHFDEVYGDGAYYWRSKERKKPHNLYTSIANIREGAEKKKYREEWNGKGFAFMDPEQPVTGADAAKVTLHYLMGYTVAYEYDAAAGVYNRFMAGKEHKDAESGKQLTAANVLIAESKHVVLDNEGRRSVDVFGPGKGYLLQKGKMNEVQWERKDGMIRAFVDGVEQAMVPGQTWVQIVPQGARIDWE